MVLSFSRLGWIPPCQVRSAHYLTAVYTVSFRPTWSVPRPTANFHRIALYPAHLFGPCAATGDDRPLVAALSAASVHPESGLHQINFPHGPGATPDDDSPLLTNLPGVGAIPGGDMPHFATPSTPSLLAP
jgi:hypothetical protein